MKKLLIIALVFIASSFCTPTTLNFATTWAGTANNQALTFSAVRDAVNNSIFFSTTTVPTGLELFTVADVTTYGLYGSFYGQGFVYKSSNQVIIKGDFATAKIDVTAGQSSCGGTNYTVQLWFDTITPTAGVTKCYTDRALTTLYVGDGTSYYGMDGIAGAIKINSSGVMTVFNPC